MVMMNMMIVVEKSTFRAVPNAWCVRVLYQKTCRRGLIHLSASIHQWDPRLDRWHFNTFVWGLVSSSSVNIVYFPLPFLSLSLSLSHTHTHIVYLFLFLLLSVYRSRSWRSQ